MLLAIVGFVMLFVMMFLLFKGKTIPLVNYEVMQDNETIEEGITLQNGSFQLKLELGSVYDITFSKSCSILQ